MTGAATGLAAANAERQRRQQVRSLVTGFGNALSTHRRGHSPVLRGSRPVGDAEIQKWRTANVFPRIEKEIAVEQLLRWADEHKEKGRAWGLLTPKQKDILRVLYDARCYVTGRLDFAYSQLCAMAKCCTQTMARAIAKFEELGLVEKWRRTVPVDDPEPDGPRVIQINNAYFLKRPPAVAARIRAALTKVADKLLPATPPTRPAGARQDGPAGFAPKPATTVAEQARNARYAYDSIRENNTRRNRGDVPVGDSSI